MKRPSTRSQNKQLHRCSLCGSSSHRVERCDLRGAQAYREAVRKLRLLQKERPVNKVLRTEHKARKSDKTRKEYQAEARAAYTGPTAGRTFACGAPAQGGWTGGTSSGGAAGMAPQAWVGQGRRSAAAAEAGRCQGCCSPRTDPRTGDAAHVALAQSSWQRASSQVFAAAQKVCSACSWPTRSWIWLLLPR